MREGEASRMTLGLLNYTTAVTEALFAGVDIGRGLSPMWGRRFGLRSQSKFEVFKISK